MCVYTRLHTHARLWERPRRSFQQLITRFQNEPWRLPLVLPRARASGLQTGLHVAPNEGQKDQAGATQRARPPPRAARWAPALTGGRGTDPSSAWKFSPGKPDSFIPKARMERPRQVRQSQALNTCSRRFPATVPTHRCAHPGVPTRTHACASRLRSSGVGCQVTLPPGDTPIPPSTETWRPEPQTPGRTPVSWLPPPCPPLLL